MPAETLAKSFSACCTRSTVAAGTMVVVVVDSGVVVLVGRLDAMATRRRAGLSVDQFLFSSGDRIASRFYGCG